MWSRKRGECVRIAPVTARQDAGRHVIGLLQVAEDIVHYVVAIVLVGVAVVVLVHSVLEAFDDDPEHFRQTQIELGVNAAVVIALVLGLVLVWRSEAAVANAAGAGGGETDTTEGLS